MLKFLVFIIFGIFFLMTSIAEARVFRSKAEAEDHCKDVRAVATVSANDLTMQQPVPIRGLLQELFTKAIALKVNSVYIASFKKDAKGRHIITGVAFPCYFKPKNEGLKEDADTKPTLEPAPNVVIPESL